MRYIYVSKPGGKPLNIGMNQAKRVARSADKRDRVIVLAHLGSMPKQYRNHQQLVRSRHRYYHEQHEELVRSGPQSDGEVNG
jgi:hypothetical protein